MYTLYHRQQELLVVVAARLARREAVGRAVPRVAGVAAGNLQPGSGNRGVLADRRSCLPASTATTVVWDSLAIAEYLAERHPGMWPADPVARAWARSIVRRDAFGLRRAAQRDDDVHPRARRRAARGRRRSPRNIARVERDLDRGTRRRFGAGRAVPVRRVLARRCVLSRRSRFASGRTASRRPAPRATYLRRCSRTRSCANGRDAALAETDDHRSATSRASSIATRSPASGPPDADDGRCRASPSCRQRIRAAAAEPRALRIRGGGTKDFYGRRIAGDVLDTRAYAGIVDYEPTELVHHRARRHAARGDRGGAARRAARCCAFEPPRFGAGGDARRRVAAGLSGPRRPYAGAVRDFVLGVRMLDGTGERLCVRRPGDEERRGLRRVAADDRRARHARRADRGLAQVPAAAGGRGDASCSNARPTRRSAASTNGAASRCRCRRRAFTTGGSSVRLSGAQPAVAAARAKLGGEAVADAERVLASVRDHTHPFFVDAQPAAMPLWRLSVQLDRAVPRPRRRAADRVGRRAALARRRRPRPIEKLRAWARAQRRPRDAVSRDDKRSACSSRCAADARRCTSG